MTMRTVLAACLLLATRQVSNGGTHACEPKTTDSPNPANDVLLLSPYIQNGELESAKSLARVGPLKGVNVPSYSGYLTVNKTTESNLFFWFFPALNNAKDAPVILWFNGGPEVSSLIGLFLEIGPYEIMSEGRVAFRNTTWAHQFNLLFIDNPVGAGYSFTKSEAGYVTNQREVARDMFEGLQQFFTLFNEYEKNDFYVAGESYAGKFVPAVAYMIHQNKDKAKMKLTGIAIGNAFCDPITMLNYADYLEQIGFLDYNQANYFRSIQDKAIKYIEQDDYLSALDMFNSIVGEHQLLNGRTPYLEQVTGIHYQLNFLVAKTPSFFDEFDAFMQRAETRKAIHVGQTKFDNDGKVAEKLAGDFMRSAKPWVAELMNNYKVLLYHGHLDIIVPAPLVASFIRSIEWDGANELAKAERIIWRDLRTGEPAGYVHHARNFTDILVRNSGHLVPREQPENAYDMIDRFINNKPFN